MNDSSILSSQIELFFSFVTFLFLLSLFFFYQKRRLKNYEKKKQKQTEILLFIEKRPPRRDKGKTWRRWETPCYNIVGILRMCVYFYHAWWRTDKIRNNFRTKTEAGKINRLNEGTLTFSLFWNIPLSHLPCVGESKGFELLLSCKHFSLKSNEHLQTTVFHHANKNVTTIAPLFLTLKSMVHSQSTVFILHYPVCSFTHVCMLLTRLVT